MRKLLLVWVAMMAWFFAQSQNTYQKAIGGLGNDDAFDVKATPISGGYIIAGSTNSFRGSVQDMFLAKLDANGDTAWVHTFGGDNVDRFEGRSSAEMPDGGFLIVGLAEGNGIGWNNRQIVFVRTAADGETVLWANSYQINNQYKEITGMAVRGNTIAITGLVQNAFGGSGNDVFVLTLDDSNPNSATVRAFDRGSSINDYAQDIIIDSNNNIVVVGYTEQSTSSTFLLKMDGSLNLTVSQNYDLNFGYNNRNYGYALTELGSNYIIAGKTFYLDDRQTGVLNGYEGTLLMAVGQNDGSITWANAYGVEGGYNFAHSVTTSGNEIIVGGESYGTGSSDLYIMKTDLVGAVTWSRATGGSNNDNAVGVAFTADGGYLAVGTTNSFSANNSDIYLTKFSAAGGTKCNQRNIQNEVRDISGDFILNGTYNATNMSATIVNITSNLVLRKVYMPASCICSEEPDFESSAPACSGQEVNFRITYGMDRLRAVQWIFNDDATVPANQDTAVMPTGITYATGGLKEVTLSVDDGACSGSKTKIINIRQSPSITNISASPATICENEMTDFTSTVAPGTGQLKYMWDFGNGQTSSSANPSDVLFTDDKVAEVFLRIENEFNCIDQTSIPVTVNPVPEVSFGSSEQQCTGEAVDFLFTAEKLTGKTYTYAWDFADGAGGIASSENPQGVVFATKGEKRISLTVTTNNGCTATQSESISIFQTPIINSISAVYPGGPNSGCEGFPINFTSDVQVSDDSQWEYTWNFGEGADPIQSSVANPVAVTYTVANTGIVFELKINDEHCSNSLTNTLDINPLPAVPVIDDATICANRSIEIGDGTGTATGFTYAWKSADKDFTQKTVVNPTVSPDAAITEYILTITETATQCSNTDTVVITMLKNAIADAGDDVEICWGDSIQIGAAYVEGQTYMWFGGDSISDRLSPSPIVNPGKTFDYVLMTRYEDCDMVFDTVRVIVHQLPDVKAKTVEHLDSINIALGESTQLFASGAIQYEWSPAETLDNEGIYNPMSTPVETGSILYWLEGIDMYGCINTDSVTVFTRMPQTWVPTSFSPNGDDLNDIFFVHVRGVEQFVLKIFTRSGEMIFSTEDPQEGWNGKRKGTDIDLPIAAYVFYYEADFSDGTKETIKDVINLVR